MKKKYEPSYAEGESKLVNAVINEMKYQIEDGDWTAIDELLRFVPRENLINFLPEEKWKRFGRK